MVTLYEMTKEQLDLYDKLSSGELIDEETGELPQELLDQLEFNKENITFKALKTVEVYKQLTADAEMIKHEETSLKERRQALEKNAKRLIDYLDINLKLLGIDKLEDVHSKISYRKSVTVEITDDLKLDEKYKKYSWEPNKTMIKEDLKNGQEVAGAYLKENKNIQIK